MKAPLRPGSSNEATSKLPNGLRWWLILVTITAVLLALLAVIFGLLVNMDTKIEMNPNGDALIRREAIESRLVAWITAGIFIVLLAAAVRAWWRAFLGGRGRRALGLSLVVAVPALLLVAALVVATITELAAEARW